MVPVALVDGDHLDADVAADDPRHLVQGPAEVVLGVDRPVLRVSRWCREPAGSRRPHGTWTASPCPWRGRRAVPEPVQGAHRRPSGSHSSSPGIVIASTLPADTIGCVAVQRGRRDTAGEVEALERGVVAVGADEPVEPALRGRRSRGWRPRSPPSPRSANGWGTGSPVACTAAIRPCSNSGTRGASCGCRPKVSFLNKQAARRDPDLRAGLVVDGVVVRHHQGEPVGGAAHREHDQDGAGRRVRRRGGGAHDRRAEDGGGGRGQRDGAGEQAAAGDAGRTRGSRARCSWSSSRSPEVEVGGVEERGQQSREVPRHDRVVLVVIFARGLVPDGRAAGLEQGGGRPLVEDLLRQLVDQGVEADRPLACIPPRPSGCGS